MTKRVTVADIAEKTGLSKGAVSYALNGRPGVSEPTRQRVLRAAAELGWQRDGPPRSPAGVVGLVLAGPVDALGAEPFLMKLISGVEAAMAPSGTGLLLQSVPDHDAEIETYRRWWAERRVDGVFLLDPCHADPRVPVLAELRLPAVVLDGRGSPSDQAAAMAIVLDHLTALGHRRVAGPGPLAEPATRRGLEWTVTVDSEAALLSGDRPPTAIVYDSDVLAVAGMAAVRERGFDVPGQVSIVVWDDSVLCEVVHPALTAVRRDVVAYGGRVAAHLLALLRGDEVGDVESPRPRLVVRESTGRNIPKQEVDR